MIQLFTGRSARSLLLAGTAAAMLSAVPAFAQDEPAPAAADGSDDTEIVVTAQKRSERLQDVPASVSVLNTENLSKQGVAKFEDYAARIPGLSLTSGRPGLTQVTLRGITTGPAQSAAATSFYVGEAPIGSVNAYTGGSNTTLDLDPTDLSQIEVLKGPQGTLYGANSMGGLIKYVTADPSFTDFSGRVSAGVNTVKDGGIGYAFRGAVNVPVVTDTLAIRASAYRRHDAGFIDIVSGPALGKDVNHADITGGRVVLAAKLGSSVRLDLQAIAQDTKTGGSSAFDVTNNDALTPIYGDLQARRITREPGKTAFRLFNATLNADLGAVQLVSSSTYQTVKAHTESDASFSFGVQLGGVGVRSIQNTNVKRFSQELRATATGLAGGFLDVQVGGYYTHENDSNAIPGFPVLNPLTGAEVPFPNIATASILSKYTEYSGFANATLHFTPKFDVLVGGRYSHIDQDYAQDYRGLIIPGGVMIASGTDKKGVATFLVSPRYKLGDNAMVYARVASGYRAGGPNAPGIGAPLTFKPDKLTSYEIGIKLATDDRKFTYDAAVFRTDWSDVQIQTSNAGFNFFVNGGKARSSGGEIVLGYHPIAGLNFGATFAYTDARLTENAPAAGGKTGDKMPYVPKVSASLSGQYDFSLGGDLGATIGGSLNRTGTRFSNYSGKAAHKLDGYSTVNLNAGLTLKGWSLSVFAKNLTNERGILALGSLGLTPASNPFAEAVIAPRTIGAEVAVKF